LPAKGKHFSYFKNIWRYIQLNKAYYFNNHYEVYEYPKLLQHVV
jgi:hypothetical protein